MAKIKKVAKAQVGKKVVAKPAAKPAAKSGPTYVNLAMAAQNRNRELGRDYDFPANKYDSAAYREGYERGLRGDKPSRMELEYAGEGQFEKMGRWEGQNKGKKNSVKKSKLGSKISSVKKAKSGAKVAKACGGAKMKKK